MCQSESNMKWLPRELSLLLFVTTLGVLAQTPPSSNVAQCIPQYDWSVSSSGQTPCLLAAFLESACGPNTSVNVIPIGEEYQGPTSSEQNPCLCSSVTYILMSACAGCQDRQFVNWTTWCEHCNNLFREVFPEPLPAFIAIPPWAFMNVTVEGAFNPDLAQSIALSATMLPASVSLTSAPISTNAPTSSSMSHNPSALTMPDVMQPPVQAPMTRNHVNTGPIVGGVVGGVLVGIIVAVLVWKLCRGRNQKHQPALAEPIDPVFDTVVPFVSPPSFDGYGTPSSSPQALLFDHQRIASGAPTSKHNRYGGQTSYRPTNITESEKEDPPPQYHSHA